MSAYKVHEVNLSEESDVIEGLIEMGFTRDQIEVHIAPQPLVGYVGDLRKNKAHIIVRRKNVNKVMSGGSSNDIGFEKVGGTYKAHISDYDSRWWKKASPKFKQAAATAKTIRLAKRKGYKVKKEKNGQKIRLRLIKNH